jgi:NADPH:quinone reductase-like Zn-dependent oxidoreductase
MCVALGAAALRPAVDRVFPFEALHEALDYLASGEQFGKICLAFA